jgi:hypothetical protein
MFCCRGVDGNVRVWKGGGKLYELGLKFDVEDGSNKALRNTLV